MFKAEISLFLLLKSGLPHGYCHATLKPMSQTQTWGIILYIPFLPASFDICLCGILFSSYFHCHAIVKAYACLDFCRNLKVGLYMAWIISFSIMCFRFEDVAAIITYWQVVCHRKEAQLRLLICPHSEEHLIISRIFWLLIIWLLIIINKRVFSFI